MLTLSYKRLRLDLKYAWTLSRNSATYKENFIITIHDGVGGWGAGETAPNVRYGELPDDFERVLKIWKDKRWTDASHFLKELECVDLPHALRCGIEEAVVMLTLSDEEKKGLQKPLPIPYTIPIMPAKELEGFYVAQDLARFSLIKLKVGKYGSQELVAALGQMHTGPVLLDGNEAYTSRADLESHIAAWSRHILIAGVEQPFAAGQDVLMDGFKGAYPFPFLADESLERDADWDMLARYYDGVNVKLQKAGGPIMAAEQIAEAKKRGLKLMVGCMVETSIGIWHAARLAASADYADLDSMLYLAHEPFGWLTENKGELLPGMVAKPG